MCHRSVNLKVNRHKLARGPKTLRIVYIVAPFLLLLALFAMVNLPTVNDFEGIKTATPDKLPSVVQETPVVASTPSTQLPPATATSSPTVTPQLELQRSPTPRAIQSIPLLGPPDKSVLPHDGTVTFYWAWTTPLEDNSEFLVLVSQGTQQLAVGTVSQTEMDHVYDLEIPVGTIWPTDLEIAWKVSLIDTNSQKPIAESVLRSFKLYVYN